MGIIEGKLNNVPLDIDGNMNVPAMQIPSFRMLLATERKVHRNILFSTQGGLGDIVCSEPVIRWAMNTIKGRDFSISSYFPELFSHLRFKEVIDMKKRLPEYEKFFVLDTIHPAGGVHCEHIVQGFSQFVDYTSIAMFRAQLPVKDRCIRLNPSDVDYNVAQDHINPSKDIIIHAGRTWQSRTLPKWFWDKVIARIVSQGYRPVLIGKESYGMVGNVNVNPEGCLDLRNKLSIMETIAILHLSAVLLTNDSSPIHMAASGDSFIGFVSTVRMPDLIYHFRHGGGYEFGWRMKNFSRGGMWETIDMCPNDSGDVRFDVVDEYLLEQWLPDPEHFADWGIQCLTQIR